MFVAGQPLEFDEKKYMYIKLLHDLKSLEKYHKLILVIQKWIFEADIVEKYLGVDMKETNSKVTNITYIIAVIICCILYEIYVFYLDSLIYCKTSISSESKCTFQSKKALIESKSKLLNVLNEIDLNLK